MAAKTLLRKWYKFSKPLNSHTDFAIMFSQIDVYQFQQLEISEICPEKQNVN